MGIVKRELDKEPDEDSWEHDNTPMADPAIQTEYEAALGRFLVAFNKVDNELGDLIKTLLSVLGRKDLVEACTHRVDFSKRVLILDLLSLSTDPGELKTAPIAEMRGLGAERNIVAHGHFDQNPFDGGYRLKGRGKFSDYSAARLDGLTVRCNAVWDHLRLLGAHYWLTDEEIADLNIPVIYIPLDPAAQ